MLSQSDKTTDPSGKAIANVLKSGESAVSGQSPFTDTRPERTAQRKLLATIRENRQGIQQQNDGENLTGQAFSRQERPFSAANPAQAQKMAATAPAQGVFTINGKELSRPQSERVSSYLQTNANQHLAEFEKDDSDFESDYGEIAEWLRGKGLDDSIVGDAEREDSVFEMGIGEMIQEISKKLTIPDKNIYSIIIDLDVNGDLQLAKQNVGVRDYKKRMEEVIKKGWVFWTSCFATSSRLYNLMKNTTAMSMTGSANDANDLQRVVAELGSQIESCAIEGIGAVFRVNIGNADHSFTLVVQGNKCEILQSFAGGDGESLAINIEGKNVFSVGEMSELLMGMAQVKDKRAASCKKLFGGNIMLDSDHTTDLWPKLSIKWEMSSLKSAKKIFELLTEKISKNLSALKEMGFVK